MKNITKRLLSSFILDPVSECFTLADLCRDLGMEDEKGKFNSIASRGLRLREEANDLRKILEANLILSKNNNG